jgi:hypothetical protein
LCSRDAIASKSHFHGTFWRHISSDCNQGSVAEQTAVPAWQGKRSRPSGNSQVTRRNQLASCGSCKRMHPRYYWLGRGCDGLHEGSAGGEQLMRSIARCSRHFCKVVASGEDGALCCEDYATSVAAEESGLR